MGIMFYGDARQPVPVEDRTLAHVKAVIIARLRRGESCTFSWKTETGHRETVWISQYISLHFVFDEPDRPTLNRQWIEELSRAAASPAGLWAVPEPADSELTDAS
ncbi:MAG: hypothetical protein ABI238_00115 [Terrimesophilobacter sp.]